MVKSSDFTVGKSDRIDFDAEENTLTWFDCFSSSFPAYDNVILFKLLSDLLLAKTSGKPLKCLSACPLFDPCGSNALSGFVMTASHSTELELDWELSSGSFSSLIGSKVGG